jgi:hypothetical protein
MLRKAVTKRNAISITLVLLALAAMALAPMPRLAQADEKVPINGTFTVQAEAITAISACAIGDTSCITCISNNNVPGAYYVDAQGIGGTSLGTVFVEILKCATPPTVKAPYGAYSGTLTTRTNAPNGNDSVAWAYSGQNDNAGDAYGFGPFSGKLTITGGTGKFEGAQGSASFTANSGPLTPGPTANSGMAMAFYSIQGKLGLPGNN